MISIIIGLAIGEVLGIATGLYMGKKLIAKYKRQRDTAVDMLGGSDQDDETATITMGGLPQSMPPGVRVRIERARIGAGLPPRDTLDGLPPECVEEIMIARILEGWEK